MCNRATKSRFNSTKQSLCRKQKSRLLLRLVIATFFKGLRRMSKRLHFVDSYDNETHVSKLLWSNASEKIFLVLVASLQHLTAWELPCVLPSSVGQDLPLLQAQESQLHPISFG